ncbi:MAG: GGDEF domain-containing protein [Clostridiales bacterium]|nr:GGDEF domain-containing protein [Clostridiales bacterium]
MKSSELHNKTFGFLVAAVSVVLVFAFVYVYFQSYSKYIESEREITETHFSEIATAGRRIVLDYFSAMSEETESAGEVLSLIGNDNRKIENFFAEKFKKTKADQSLVVSADGRVLYGHPEYQEIFKETIEYAFSKGTSISNIAECSDGVKRFAVASSFTMDAGGQAVVMMIYPRSVLDSFIDLSAVSSEGRLCIVDSNGGFVARQTHSAPWVEEGRYLVDGNLQNRLLVIKSTADGKEYAAYSKPLGINDWFVVYVMPKVLIDEKEQVGSNRIHIFGTACLLFGFVFFGIGLYKNYIRAHRLRLFKMKFKIATSQSARAAFEYDKRADRLTLISECEHISLPKPYLSLAEMTKLIHPADRTAYGQALIDLRRNSFTSATLRISGFAGTDAYRWYHVTAKRLDNKGGWLTIGTVEDIDEREKERLILAEKATTDCLTGLYNRAETEKIINERLQKLDENEHSAFAIIDLDDFKNINDEYGHDSGDKALLFFAEKLRATFRFGDVIGRLGGDEFVVYMTLTSDKKVVERRIQELMDSLKMKRSDDNTDVPAITCSVGCCIASKGDTFDVLYKRADTALYESKTMGKGLSTIA